jgi:hypothetical protein
MGFNSMYLFFLYTKVSKGQWAVRFLTNMVKYLLVERIFWLTILQLSGLPTYRYFGATQAKSLKLLLRSLDMSDKNVHFY